MEPARVTVLARATVDRLTTEQLRDALDAGDPDAVLATWPGANVRLRTEIPEYDDLPTLVPGADRNRSGAGGPDVHRLGDVDVAVASTDDEIAAIPDLEADERIDPDSETYVVTDRLALSVRPTALETDLEGLGDYREALDRGCEPTDSTPVGSHTHVSTGIPAGYRREWDGLVVRGAAPSGTVEGTPAGPGSTDEPAVATLALGPRGTASATEYRPASLGLRAIRGVGSSRADTLRAAGVRSRTDLADASVRDLAEYDGLGPTVSARLVERARAFETGAVLRSGDQFFPTREPIFVDVETDGLSPSIVWLVGALDRGEDGTQDRYHSFLNREPDDPGAALSAFLSWYVANADGRPVVAYNGLEFDFPVLEAQIDRHGPEYADAWADAWTFDPLSWAVRDDNAVLPGRTNRLEDVATALGDESIAASRENGCDGLSTSPLSGAEVARQYRAWMHERGEHEGEEPDWDRLRAYCEDDVRALAAVYDALDESQTTTGGVGGTGGASRTKQGSLGGF